MTEFRITADVYLRLCKVALQPDEQRKTQQFTDAIRSVRIEYRDGVAVAVATNGQSLVCECLNDCGENGEVSITIDPALQAIAEAERDASGALIITQAPGWTVVRGIETGKMYPLNGEVPGEWPDWRALVPDVLPSKNTGAFVVSAHTWHRLTEASPSGVVVFPKFADKDQPILMRDQHDPNWFALAFLDDAGRVDVPKYAEIPEWAK